MLMVRFAESDPTRLAQRDQHFEAHRKHLRTSGINIIMSGPLISWDEGAGSALVVAEVQTMQEFEIFNSNDPFVQHHVYSHVRLQQWNVTISMFPMDNLKGEHWAALAPSRP